MFSFLVPYRIYFGVLPKFFLIDLLKPDTVSILRMDESSLFHSFIVEGIYDEFVSDSLQKGTMISEPFLRGYDVILCIVGGIRLPRNCGASPLWIL